MAIEEINNIITSTIITIFIRNFEEEKQNPRFKIKLFPVHQML
jgi:hypothetical protein